MIVIYVCVHLGGAIILEIQTHSILSGQYSYDNSDQPGNSQLYGYRYIPCENSSLSSLVVRFVIVTLFLHYRSLSLVNNKFTVWKFDKQKSASKYICDW